MNNRVEPMPDEPARAYAGRLALFIGAESPRSFDQWVNKQCERLPDMDRNSPRLQRLAVIAGKSGVEFARQHSMMGIFRVAAKTDSLWDYGAPEAFSLTKHLGMLTHKSQAHVCPQCVQEDLQHWRFSWYRRSHQLQGVDYCAVHKTGLHRVLSDAPWTWLPDHWIETERTAAVTNTAETVVTNSFEARFIELSCVLIERSRPYALQNLCEGLDKRAKALGLRISRDGVRINFPDHLLQVAPRSWIERNWPRLLQKNPGKAFDLLNLAVSSRTAPATGLTYATAMAALWDDPIAAYQALQQIDKAVPVSPSAPKRIVKPNDFWQGKVWSVYRKHRGSVKDMALEIGTDRKHLGEKLKALGLPSMRHAATAPRWKAFVRFQAGEDLKDACEAELANMADVLELVRISCAPVATVAKDIIDVRRNTTHSFEMHPARRVLLHDPLRDALL